MLNDLPADLLKAFHEAGFGNAILADVDRFLNALCANGYEIIKFDTERDVWDVATCPDCTDGIVPGPRGALQDVARFNTNPTVEALRHELVATCPSHCCGNNTIGRTTDPVQIDVSTVDYESRDAFGMRTWAGIEAITLSADGDPAVEIRRDTPQHLMTIREPGISKLFGMRGKHAKIIGRYEPRT